MHPPFSLALLYTYVTAGQALFFLFFFFSSFYIWLWAHCYFLSAGYDISVWSSLLFPGIHAHLVDWMLFLFSIFLFFFFPPLVWGNKGLEIVRRRRRKKEKTVHPLPLEPFCLDRSPYISRGGWYSHTRVNNTDSRAREVTCERALTLLRYDVSIHLYKSKLI